MTTELEQLRAELQTLKEECAAAVSQAKERDEELRRAKDERDQWQAQSAKNLDDLRNYLARDEQRTRERDSELEQAKTRLARYEAVTVESVNLDRLASTINGSLKCIDDAIENIDWEDKQPEERANQTTRRIFAAYDALPDLIRLVRRLVISEHETQQRSMVIEHEAILAREKAERERDELKAKECRCSFAQFHDHPRGAESGCEFAALKSAPHLTNSTSDDKCDDAQSAPRQATGGVSQAKERDEELRRAKAEVDSLKEQNAILTIRIGNAIADTERERSDRKFVSQRAREIEQERDAALEDARRVREALTSTKEFLEHWNKSHADECRAVTSPRGICNCGADEFNHAHNDVLEAVDAALTPRATAAGEKEQE